MEYQVQTNKTKGRHSAPKKRRNQVFAALLAATAMIVPTALSGPALATAPVSPQPGVEVVTSETNAPVNPAPVVSEATTPEEAPQADPEVVATEEGVVAQRAVEGSSARAGEDPRPNYIKLQKVVNDVGILPDLEPGDPFSYYIQMTASEVDQVDAQIVDNLPNLAGFTLQDVTLDGIPGVITWYNKDGAEIAKPTILAEGDYFTVRFTEDLGDGKQGVQITSGRAKGVIPIKACEVSLVAANSCPSGRPR